jgi:hypothetical protein
MYECDVCGHSKSTAQALSVIGTCVQHSMLGTGTIKQFDDLYTVGHGNWRGEKGQDKCKVVLWLQLACTRNPDGN